MYKVEQLNVDDLPIVYAAYKLNKITFAPKDFDQDGLNQYFLSLLDRDIEVLVIKWEDTILGIIYAFHRLGHIEIHCSIIEGSARQIFEAKEYFINEYGADKNLMFIVPYDSRPEAALARLEKRLVVKKVGEFDGYYGNNSAIIYQNKRA